MHKELCYVPGSPGLCIIAGMGNAGGDRSFGLWAAPPAAPLPHGSGAQLRSLLLEAVGQHWGPVGMGADPGSERASPAHQTTCTPSQPVFWGRHRAAPQQGRSSRPPQGTCHGRCDVGQQPLCTVPEHSQGQNHHPATGAGLWQGPQSHPTPCCLWGARTLQALGRALQARGHRDGPRAFPGGLPRHGARGHRASPDAGVNAPGCVPRAPPGFPAGAEGATPPACPRSTPGTGMGSAGRYEATAGLPRGYHRVPPAPPRRRGPPGRGRSRLGAAAHRLPAG